MTAGHIKSVRSIVACTMNPSHQLYDDIVSQILWHLTRAEAAGVNIEKFFSVAVYRGFADIYRLKSTEIIRNQIEFKDVHHRQALPEQKSTRGRKHACRTT